MLRQTDRQTRLEQAGRKVDVQSSKWVFRRG